MTPYELGLPPRFTIKGAIYDTTDPAYLREDLMQIDTPSGHTISVGREPHCDPTGDYEVIVYRGYSTNVEEEFHRRSFAELVSLLRDIASRYDTRIPA